MKINQASGIPQPKRPNEGAGTDQRQSLLSEAGEMLQEVAAEVIELGSKLPPLKRLGYELYDHFTRPKDDSPLVKNTQVMDKRLMRGSQPTQAGFATLKQQGINTVINLRPESDWEKPMVEGLGMKYIHLPLPAVGEPTIQQGLDFLAMVTDPANGNAYFHCQRGKDRTGAMAAAYRIAVQGWTLDQAMAEMRQFGFKEGFEEDKLDFVQKFADYWEDLDPLKKSLILHKPIV